MMMMVMIMRVMVKWWWCGIVLVVICCNGGILVVMSWCFGGDALLWLWCGYMVAMECCFGGDVLLFCWCAVVLLICCFIVLLITIEKIVVVTELLNKVEYKRKSTKYTRIYRHSWIGLIWLSIGTGGGHLSVRQWTLRFYKMRGIFWLDENRLASQEGLCCMELVSKVVSFRSHMMSL
jgi:hypothetical protein